MPSHDFSYIRMDGNFDELSIDDIRWKYQSGEITAQPTAEDKPIRMVSPKPHDYLMVSLTCSGQKEFFIGSAHPEVSIEDWSQLFTDGYYAEFSRPTSPQYCTYGSVRNMAGSMTVMAGNNANQLLPCQPFVTGQPSDYGAGTRTYAVYDLMAWTGEVLCTTNTDMDVPIAPPGCGRDPLLAPPPPSPPPLLPPPTSPSPPPTPPTPPTSPSTPPTPPAEIPLDCISGPAPATTNGANRYHQINQQIDGTDEISIDNIRRLYQSGELTSIVKESNGGSGLPLILGGNDYLLVTLKMRYEQGVQLCQREFYIGTRKPDLSSVYNVASVDIKHCGYGAVDVGGSETVLAGTGTCTGGRYNTGMSNPAVDTPLPDHLVSTTWALYDLMGWVGDVPCTGRPQLGSICGRALTAPSPPMPPPPPIGDDGICITLPDFEVDLKAAGFAIFNPLHGWLDSYGRYTNVRLETGVYLTASEFSIGEIRKRHQSGGFIIGNSQSHSYFMGQDYLAVSLGSSDSNDCDALTEKEYYFGKNIHAVLSSGNYTKVDNKYCGYASEYPVSSRTLISTQSNGEELWEEHEWVSVPSGAYPQCTAGEPKQPGQPDVRTFRIFDLMEAVDGWDGLNRGLSACDPDGAYSYSNRCHRGFGNEDHPLHARGAHKIGEP